jgi:hypothetical protein
MDAGDDGARVSLEAGMTITPAQCKAARKLLGWSLEVFANKVRMSEIDIARFEAGKLGVPMIGSAMIRRALDQAGIEFIDEPPGARLRARPR